MKKRVISFLGSMILMLLAVLVGAPGSVCMAAAVDLPDGGKQVATGVGGEGAATETGGREANPDLYLSDIDKRITKIRPMATPIDQISRYAKSVDSKSMEVKYYSIGTKPIKTTVSEAFTAQTTGTTAVLKVSDPAIFDESDTIRVVGVKGYKAGGSEASKEDLVLSVIGADPTTGMPVVVAVNGKNNTNNQPTYLPAISADVVLIRMGKACAELDAQTSSFANVPTAEIQYCQNFMMQIEQSTFDKIAAKEVDWTFSDLEEDSVYDMRMGQENSFLFGAKGKIKHPTKRQDVYFTGGIWWQAGKDLIVGKYDSTKKVAVITDDELVDITKTLFTGVGSGNKRKILFAGSEMLAAFSKIESDKFRLKESVEVWNLKFKSFDTDFGEILVMHHELFDQNEMSDCGLCMDPEFLTKKTHVSWARNVLDLKAAGIRNSNAVVIQEVVCLYLRYAKAHARMKLAKA